MLTADDPVRYAVVLIALLGSVVWLAAGCVALGASLRWRRRLVRALALVERATRRLPVDKTHAVAEPPQRARE